MSLSIVIRVTALASALSLGAVPVAGAQDAPPTIRTYKTLGDTTLKAHIFGPPARDLKPRPAIVLLHGGGWNVGAPEWAYTQARRFAAKGLIAISVQYRLSDFKTTTPLDAMADTRDAFRWIRANARELRVDPEKIAVYAWSAGGHLGLSALLFSDVSTDGVSAGPNALVLLSPAVAVARSGYVKSLLLGRAEPASISPIDHVRPGLPPILIVNGDSDTVTPVGAARSFCEAVTAARGRCDLHVYPGLGHLLTRNLDRRAQEMGPFDPDPDGVADAFAKGDAFLESLGYLTGPPR